MNADSTHHVVTPVGIDLGTTQTAAAVLVDGRTRMAADELGNTLLPSAIYFQEDRVLVGREALKARQFDMAGVAVSPKRDIGQPAFRQAIRGRQFPPEVLQACILREIKNSVLRTVAGDYHVVVSVPAYFDEVRRRATESAAAMADLPLIDLVPEPVAAALSFGEYHGYLDPAGTPSESLILLVYDLGGGTFDVTLIELTPGCVRTLGTDGDVRLGGHLWDRRLADYLAQKFEAQTRLDPRDDAAMLARLEDQAHYVRESLTLRHSVSIPVEFHGRRRDVTITREQLNLLTEDLLDRTLQTTSELLQHCDVGWSQVDRLLLAGGATRMPMVTHALRDISGLAPDHSVNPDEAVARGAAIYCAHRLAVDTGQTFPLRVQVVDVAAHSLGMEGVDVSTGRKENKVLIPRNTPLPATVVRPFLTRWENQPSIVVKVLEGESTNPAECAVIGHAVLDQLPQGLRRGQPVHVVFDLPRNGTLQVRLRIEDGTELIMDLTRAGSVTRQAIHGWQAVLHGSGRFATFEDMLRQVLSLPSTPNVSPWTS